MGGEWKRRHQNFLDVEKVKFENVIFVIKGNKLIMLFEKFSKIIGKHLKFNFR